MEMNNYDVFDDRVRSLLDRWSRFNKANPGTSTICIKSCLLEVNDEYTQQLMGEEPATPKEQIKMMQVTLSARGQDEASSEADNYEEIEVHTFYVVTTTTAGHVWVRRKDALKVWRAAIEMAVCENLDYGEIAENAGLLEQFDDLIDKWEPTGEEYLVDILAELLYDNKVTTIEITEALVIEISEVEDLSKGHYAEPIVSEPIDWTKVVLNKTNESHFKSMTTDTELPSMAPGSKVTIKGGRYNA